MKKIFFGLGTILFIWTIIILLGGVISKNTIEGANILSLGLYKLVSPDLAFIICFSLAILGFCLMYLSHGDKKYIK